MRVESPLVRQKNVFQLARSPGYLEQQQNDVWLLKGYELSLAGTFSELYSFNHPSP